MPMSDKLLPVLAIWSFSVVFIGEQEADLRGAVQMFDTNWADAGKAFVIGICLGFVLRIPAVSKYIDSSGFGFLLSGMNLAIIGIGVIGMGVLGALIVYIKFEQAVYMRVPLHASVVGLSLLAMDIAAECGRRE
ncbi:MAG: hypothetical protein Hals2KO_05400 [Halioglobus sp.]